MVDASKFNMERGMHVRGGSILPIQDAWSTKMVNTKSLAETVKTDLVLALNYVAAKKYSASGALFVESMGQGQTEESKLVFSYTFTDNEMVVEADGELI